MFLRNKKSEYEKIHKLFSKSIGKKQLDKISANKDEKEFGYEEGLIYYILFQVKEESYKEIRQLIEKSINIIIEYDGIISNMMSSVVLVYFMLNDEKAIEKQVKLSSHLIDILGNNIKIVYGNANGAVGLLGSTKRLQHVPIIPNMTIAINELIQLEYGKFIKV